MQKLDYNIAIIGAGFAGLGAAIRLKKSGEDSFVVLSEAKKLVALGEIIFTQVAVVIYLRICILFPLNQTQIGHANSRNNPRFYNISKTAFIEIILNHIFNSILKYLGYFFMKKKAFILSRMPEENKQPPVW